MLKLYHAGSSVCSQKARIAMSEKGLDWESAELDFSRNEQLTPDYLALNPNGVVPTLVHDDLVVRESSVIIDYLDGLSATNPLMPTDPGAQAITKLWLIRTIEIHEAINSMTFATAIREAQLKTRTPAEIEDWLVSLPNPQITAKRRDLFARGAQSVFVDGALFILNQMLKDMHEGLAGHAYLTGDTYGLADTAITAYVDRLERLGMQGLWQGRYDRIEPWLRAMQARPSYAEAVTAYIPEEQAMAVRAAGSAAWSVIARRLG